MDTLSPRSYCRLSSAASWEEIWEAGPYYERVAELLEGARHHAVFVGWQIDSRLPFPRPYPNGETLREKVIRLCESRPGLHIYFLMWSHSTFYVVEREVWQGRIWDEIHPRIHFLFDSRHPLGASHHEKICLIDGRIALCGGVDLCADRWDTPQHLHKDPRRSLDWKHERHGPYHDLSVQVTGPISAEIHRHVARRWKAISKIPFPPPLRHTNTGNGHPVYFSRTISSIDAEKEPVREIEFLYRDLVRLARRRIIIEGQYYWSRPFNDLLISKMLEMRGTDFEIVLILAELKNIKSPTWRMARYEMGLLRDLECAATACGIRLTLGTPLSYGFDPASGPSKPIYIHSKLMIIDDRFLSIGSANLADRAFRLDTEVNLTLEGQTEADQAHIRKVSNQVLKHWRQPGINLQPFHTQMQGVEGWLSNYWQHGFDPPLPWLYRFKRRLRSLRKRKPLALPVGILGAWFLAALVAFTVSNVLSSPEASVVAALFTSVWLLPIPFLPAFLLSVLHLGLETASLAMLIGLTVASLWGYALVRMFPTLASLYARSRIGRTKQAWIRSRLGTRRFSDFIIFVIDPRVSLRTKILYQGLYYAPLPWFLLLNALILPSLFYLVGRIVSVVLESLMVGL